MDINQEVVNIVQTTLSKQFDIQVDESSKLTFEKKEEVDVTKKEFEGIATDFVINVFLPTQEGTLNFVSVIYDTFDSAISKYKAAKGIPEDSLYFIYKGGNVLRILAREFLHELPGETAGMLEEYYLNFFKKSDSDFSMYLDPKLPNFDEVFDDLTKMSYLLLCHLRKIFMANLDDYFNYFKGNDENQNEILLQNLQKLNATGNLNDNQESPFYGGRFLNLTLGKKQVDTNGNVTQGDSSKYDNLVEFDGNMTNLAYYNIIPLHKRQMPQQLQSMAQEQGQLYDGEDKNEFYASVNKTTRFKLEGLTMAFNLVRMKINFKTEFEYRPELNKSNDKMKVGGELIDVSIIHKDTTQLPDFFAHKHDYISEFSHTDASGKTIRFKATSFEYMMHDLELILFETQKFPWNDVKYGKRIKRLLFLYFVDMVSTQKSMPLAQVKTYLTNVKNDLFAPIANLTTQSNPSQAQGLSKLDSYLAEAKSKNLHFARLLEEYKRVLSISADEGEKLVEFVKVLDENMALQLKVLDQMSGYVQRQGRIDEKDLYDFSQFGGAKNDPNSDYWRMKYLKYKAKYMRLLSNRR